MPTSLESNAGVDDYRADRIVATVAAIAAVAAAAPLKISFVGQVMVRYVLSRSCMNLRANVLVRKERGLARDSFSTTSFASIRGISNRTRSTTRLSSSRGINSRELR